VRITAYYYILLHIAAKKLFYKIGHNSGPRGSPDMILAAFDGKFHEKKDEIPPRACRPPYTSKYSILGI
jgi:hypothetical protein